MSDEVRPGGENRRKILVRAAIRPVVTTLVLLVVYFVAPLDGIDDLGTIALLIFGLGSVGTVAVWQIRRVLQAEYPAVQAVEAAAATLALYIVGYSTLYYLLSASQEDGFSELLSRIDALYFCLTVFATVGFGDIVATTDPTRAVVSVQMVVNLILIAVGIRVLAGAVRWRRQQRENPT